MMKLWLDDIRPVPDGWEGFVCPWKTLNFVLRMGDHVDEWSLDHDLGEDIPTGYDFLSMIELLLGLGLNVHVPEKVGIHSDNGPGIKSMRLVLESIYRTIEAAKSENRRGFDPWAELRQEVEAQRKQRKEFGI